MNPRPQFVAMLIFAVMCYFATGCASAPVAPAKAAKPVPIAAIEVVICGGAAAMYIVFDPDHMARFSQKDTEVFTRAPDGTMTSAHTEPVNWAQVFALGKTAVLSSTIVLPCPQPGVAT